MQKLFGGIFPAYETIHFRVDLSQGSREGFCFGNSEKRGKTYECIETSFLFAAGRFTAPPINT